MSALIIEVSIIAIFPQCSNLNLHSGVSIPKLVPYSGKIIDLRIY